MVLQVYLLFYSCDSQGEPIIAPSFIPYITSVLGVTRIISSFVMHPPGIAFTSI